MIDEYLLANCRLIIDELNYRFRNFNNIESLKEFADIEFNEADLVFMLGYPFRSLASYNMQGKAGDITVKSKNFIIEVKYLRNTMSEELHYTNAAPYKSTFEKDYTWLCREVNKGNKGKRAFVLGWFNAFSSFASIMQLGKTKGRFPKLDRERLEKFPFLTIDKYKDNTKDIYYAYDKQYNNLITDHLNEQDINCLFLGKETDKFHFAIYY
ncbi:MAG: hypothetical protein PHS04_10320 [Tissierellia bacterium]|nr:hypothetical protein [Tissierellia bacterium]